MIIYEAIIDKLLLLLVNHNNIPIPTKQILYNKKDQNLNY